MIMNNAIYTAYENYGFKAVVKKIGQRLLVHVYNLSSTRLEQKNLIEKVIKKEDLVAPQETETAVEDELE